MDAPVLQGLKKTILFLAAIFSLTGCKDKGPDVSGIKVNIAIGRFDKLLFEKTDTLEMTKSANNLQLAFPSFTNDFLNNILGLPPLTASTPDSAVLVTLNELKHFIRVTRPLYDSLATRFNNLDWLEKELTRSFQHLKYYYPSYKVPNVVSYVGPFNSPGIAITNDALAIGLQLYGGKNFSYYTSAEGQEIFPLYISRTFEPQYITANAMKAIEQDLYPDNTGGGPLVDQMIEKGKQWYMLTKLIPGIPDSITTGYTQAQLKWCEDNEGQVWSFFLQNNFLYTAEFDIIKNFIGEAPNTQEMSDASPGNIGQWVGWRIVQKYAEKNNSLSLDAVMRTTTKKILADTKYKPR